MKEKHLTVNVRFIVKLRSILHYTLMKTCFDIDDLVKDPHF